jgi:hypothetical protein
MKVTARDIAALVRDTQVEMMRKRSAEPKDSLIDALILDEMQKMTSLVDGEGAPQTQTTEGSMSLDPSAFVDTSNWAGEMGLGSQHPPQHPGQHPHQHPHPRARPTRPMPRDRVTSPTPSPEIESLEQILEPERPATTATATKNPSWLVIARSCSRSPPRRSRRARDALPPAT